MIVIKFNYCRLAAGILVSRNLPSRVNHCRVRLSESRRFSPCVTRGEDRRVAQRPRQYNVCHSQFLLCHSQETGEKKHITMETGQPRNFECQVPWPKMVLGCELELLQPYFLDVFRLYKPSLVGKTSSLLTIFLSLFFRKSLSCSQIPQVFLEFLEFYCFTFFVYQFLH